jgi:hypothetical protein
VADNRQVRGIKDYIVKAHRAGACGKFGEHIPREKMGRNGKGVAYVGPQPWTSSKFQHGYRLAFGHD